MAKQKYNTLGGALGLDVTTASYKEIKRATKTLISTNVRRSKTLRARGIVAPSKGAKYRKTSIRTGTSKADLIKIYERERAQATKETATLKGYNQFIKNVSEGFKREGFNVNLTDLAQKERNEFFKLYDEFSKTELGKYYKYNVGKYRVFEEIQSVVERGGSSFNNLMDYMRDRVAEYDEIRQQEEEETTAALGYGKF